MVAIILDMSRGCGLYSLSRLFITVSSTALNLGCKWHLQARIYLSIVGNDRSESLTNNARTHRIRYPLNLFFLKLLLFFDLKCSKTGFYLT